MVVKRKKRILVIAHGHPDFSRGGGEIAAYSLFSGYMGNELVEDAFFLARIDGEGNGSIKKYAGNEYLWDRKALGGIFMEGANSTISLRNLAAFLRSTKSDVVHLHHAVHMGYEILEIIRRELPEAIICFTLHEYIPICHNDGQMVKTDGALCFKPGLSACQKCFPDFGEEDFWQRKRRFMHYFSHVDVFFAPSNFLRGRYVEWGIPPEKIFTLENGLRDLPSCPPRKINHSEKRNRFGFFGQITEFKGLELLFRALNLLSANEREKIILEIHGSGCGEKAEKHTRKLMEEYENLAAARVARWIGPYDPTQISGRMNGVDWVVVPSIWWENSPVVIQEAFACGRPVLAANLGGMAEKVRNDVDGLLVSPRNPQAWAEAMLECAEDKALWERLRGGIQKPAGPDVVAAKSMEIIGLADIEKQENC